MTNSFGLTYFGRPKVPLPVVVDRLQDRVAFAQMAERLLHNVEIVGARVDRRQALLAALAAVVAVVVVGAEHGAALLAQNLGDARRQRRLARRRIADDSQYDRVLNPLRHFLLPSTYVFLFT